MAPKNAVYFIQAEVSLLMTAMKWSSRSGPKNLYDEESDPLFRGLAQLKDILNNVSEIDELEPISFLIPFLDVIRSEDTTGPITGIALTAVDKFLGYGLIHPDGGKPSATAIEAIADAVTHARFVGTDPSSDEVVLMKIVYLLRTLLLTPAGILLSNDAVCEIMQSCFRICFENRLSELLRRTSESALMNMTQLLFTRLPELRTDPQYLRKLKMRKGGMESSRLRRKKGSTPPSSIALSSTSSLSKTISKQSSAKSSSNSSKGNNPPANSLSPQPAQNSESCQPNATQLDSKIVTNSNEADDEKMQSNAECNSTDSSTVTTCVDNDQTNDPNTADSLQTPADTMPQRIQMAASTPEVTSPPLYRNAQSGNQDDDVSGVVVCASSSTEYTNPRGVRFTTDINTEGQSCAQISQENNNSDTEYVADSASDSHATHHDSAQSSKSTPYGLPCVKELLRFIVSLISPDGNADNMIHMGLTLITVALESGADNIPLHKPLINMVKDEMTKNLMALLYSERLSLFAASLRVCFLLFESMRSHLKFQLEMYLQRLMEIITSDSEKISFEQREIALESIVLLWRIPGLVTELYLNYDCDLFCSNLFEDLTKLLSKNAFPVSRLLGTHVLSLDALLAVIDTIEQHCNSRVQLGGSLAATKEESSTLCDQESVLSENDLPLESSSVDAEMDDSSLEVETQPSKSASLSATPDSTTDPNKRPCSLPLLPPLSNSSKPPAVHSNSSRFNRPIIRPNRMPITGKIPTEEELAAAKYKKKLLLNGTEKFNQKPKEGILYLQNHGLLSKPLQPDEIAQFLRENPRLEKRQIGDYISARSNSPILQAFLKTFDFKGVRVDEALRQYLETFRLPGEAPLIQHVLEHFADSWHTVNDAPFASADATFTLSYAVVMLNTDQHNPNSKKQNIPMTVDDFKRNLKGINGGKNFEPKLLEDIYNAIKHDEIVMPSEQSGYVRENYLWKILLRRGNTSQGIFLHIPTGYYDHDLFTLIWGPTVAALSFIFDKTSDVPIHQKAVAGFRKCATISAHYGLSDVFDNMVISLCKFTTLINPTETPENVPVHFGRNEKAQLACRTVFQLALRHADILRDGWKNLMECMMQLYRSKLLPESLMETDDFINPDKKIKLHRENQMTIQKQETGMLSSFYSYFTSDSNTNKGPSQEEMTARQKASECIKECQPEQLIDDSKFLQDASLIELVKALVVSIKGDLSTNDDSPTHSNRGDEEFLVFYLELLLRVLLQNRDRMTALWPYLRAYMYSALIGCPQPGFLLERSVVGLLRLAIRLLRRQEMTSEVFSCLKLLLLMKSSHLASVSRHVVYGLHDLIHTHAPNIPSPDDWRLLLSILETCGAGAIPVAAYRAKLAADLAPIPDELANLVMNSSQTRLIRQSPERSHTNDETCPDCSSAQSDSETSGLNAGQSRGYTSDSELYDGGKKTNPGWIIVDTDNLDESESSAVESDAKRPPTANGSVKSKSTSPSKSAVVSSVNPFSIALEVEFRHRDAKALVKACETITFLIRDPAHITPANFQSCVHTLRVFVEACLHGSLHSSLQRSNHSHTNKKKTSAHQHSASKSGQHYSTQTNSKRTKANQLSSASISKKDATSHPGSGGISDIASDAGCGSGDYGLPNHPSFPSKKKKFVPPSSGMKRSKSNPAHMAGKGAADPDSDSDQETYFHNVSIQPECAVKLILLLLDLLHTLHTRSNSIYTEWSSQSGKVTSNQLWEECWCPLLQAMARLCCDSRRVVRQQAITYLQRSLLTPDLQTLTATEWESCFTKVLFPLLTCLLEPLNPNDSSGMEETRMRASTLLSRVFLQHLTPLFSLPTFVALWLTILDFIDKYMHANNSDLLVEAVPESLKNMLLVMETAGILKGDISSSVSLPTGGSAVGPCQMWKLTWDRISVFLPHMQEELFPDSLKEEPTRIEQSELTCDQPNSSEKDVTTNESTESISHETLDSTTSSPKTSSLRPTELASVRIMMPEEVEEDPTHSDRDGEPTTAGD